MAHIARTERGDVLVSTIRLLNLSGGPEIWETMVFDYVPSDVDNPCWRYATEKQALVGHARAVGLVERGDPIPDRPMSEPKKVLRYVIERDVDEPDPQPPSYTSREWLAGILDNGTAYTWRCLSGEVVEVR